MSHGNAAFSCVPNTLVYRGEPSLVLIIPGRYRRFEVRLLASSCAGSRDPESLIWRTYSENTICFLFAVYVIVDR